MSTGLVERAVHLSSTCWITGDQVYARGSTKPVYAFKGIPYAKPPVGQLRFMPPQPTPLWAGDRDGSQFGPYCPQNMAVLRKQHSFFEFPDNMSEDCLYLNIFTPSPEPSGNLPTMFWIHGGSYLHGFSNFYDGSALAAFHNVVIVTCNYRVGPLGFLSTGDEVIHGNMGLLDQLAALKWVKEHISKFGGNPNNVTVFGQSAGAISIALHMVSPLAKGLFRKAILQSGTCLYPGCTWTQKQVRKWVGKRLQKIGYDTSDQDSTRMLKYLQDLPVSVLVKNFKGIAVSVTDGHYLPEDPKILWETGRSLSIPILIGVTSHEGAQFVAEATRSTDLPMPNYERAAEIVYMWVSTGFFRGSKQVKNINKLLLETYLSEQDSPEQLAQGLVKLYGDLLFVLPVLRTSNIHSAKSNVWLYQLDRGVSVSPFPSWVRADHSYDVPFVFGAPWLHQFPDILTDPEKNVSATMMKYWTQFAATGYPNKDGLQNWPMYNSNKPVHLSFDDPTSIGKNANITDTISNVWMQKIPHLLRSTDSHL